MKIRVHGLQAARKRLKRVAENAADRFIEDYARRYLAKRMAEHFAICSAAYHATDVPESSAIHIVPSAAKRERLK